MNDDCIEYGFTQKANNVLQFMRQSKMSQKEIADAALKLSDETFRILIFIKFLDPESNGLEMNDIVTYLEKEIKVSPQQIEKAIKELTKKGYLDIKQNQE